jgi:glycosyltransferase involved in cell wall biosynthesis
LPNLIAVLAKRLFHRRLKVVINVHDVTSRILVESGLKGFERVILRWLVRALYPMADMIVAAAVGIKRDMIDNFGIAAERIVVINNPIDLQRIRERAREVVDHPWFCRNGGPIVVAVGRLVKLKGYDFMIRAFARLPSEYKARLVILGEGPERPRLERLIEDHGLKGRAALLGFQENPWKYMARADMLVLSSITEGLPNVIGEAMALDLPILATDCSAGVREYVQHGENGLLVSPGSVAALARGMERMIGERELCAEMRQRSRARIERFDLPRIISAYEDVLERTIAE